MCCTDIRLENTKKNKETHGQNSLYHGRDLNKVILEYKSTALP
jgi:hypothetical protein